MPAEAGCGWLRIEVVFCCQPGLVDRTTVLMPPGALLGQALQASGVLDRHALAAATLQLGVWSRVQPLDCVLRDLDRVEIYRPLVVDPKQARRLRDGRQRERAAAG